MTNIHGTSDSIKNLFNFFFLLPFDKKSGQIGESLVCTIVQGYCDADRSTRFKLSTQRWGVAGD